MKRTLRFADLRHVCALKLCSSSVETQTRWQRWTNWIKNQVLSDFLNCRSKRNIASTMVFVCFFLATYFLHREAVYSEYQQTRLTTFFNVAAAKRCKRMDLTAFSSTMAGEQKRFERHTCSGQQDWLVIENGTVRLRDDLKKPGKKVTCKLTSFLRINDRMTIWGKGQPLTQNDSSVRLDADIFDALCYDYVEGTGWANLMTGIHLDETVVQRSEKILSGQDPETKLNVLIWAFGLVSGAQFTTRMKNSHAYLTQNLKATVLKIFNSVSDDVSGSFLPVLTGKSEPEVQLSLDHHSDPYVWKFFAEQGYVTLYTEDLSQYGTFGLRMSELSRQLTDHYGRTFNKKAEQYHDQHGNCVRSVSRITAMSGWVRQLWDVYPKVPKFAAAFHNEFSVLELADLDFLDWLKILKSSGVLNNTILITMSDLRIEPQLLEAGKFEEPSPFVAFVLPRWFQERFPNAYANIHNNAGNSLTTPFDIYATLITILNTLNNKKDVLSGQLYTRMDIPRGVSLFLPIPEYRGCPQAEIPALLCMCLESTQVDIDDTTVQAAAYELVKSINSLLEEVKSQCSMLTIKAIKKVEKAAYNPAFVAYSRSKLINDSKPQLVYNPQPLGVLYTFEITVEPSGGVFEGSVVHFVVNNQFILNKSFILRLNDIGNQSSCISEKYPDLRYYCFCTQRKISH